MGGHLNGLGALQGVQASLTPRGELNIGIFLEDVDDVAN